METKFKVDDEVMVDFPADGRFRARVLEVDIDDTVYPYRLRALEGPGADLPDGLWGYSAHIVDDEPIPATPSARPDWLTDEMLAEMRRLRGTDKDNPLPQCEGWSKMHVTMFTEMRDHNDECWLNGWPVGKDDARLRGTSWLTPEGHTALAAIEAEERGVQPVFSVGDEVQMNGQPHTAGAITSVRWCGTREHYEYTWGEGLAECIGVLGGIEAATPGDRDTSADGYAPWKPGDRESSALERKAAEVEKHGMVVVDMGPPPALGHFGCDGKWRDAMDGRVRVAIGKAEDANLAEGMRPDGHTTGLIITDPENRAAYLAVESGAEPAIVEVTVTVIKCVACNDEGYIPGLATPLVPCPRCGR